MDSTKYMGMEVHPATISGAVLNSTGGVLMESIMETKAATMVAFLEGLGGSIEVSFEEGTCARWRYHRCSLE